MSETIGQSSRRASLPALLLADPVSRTVRRRRNIRGRHHRYFAGPGLRGKKSAVLAGGPSGSHKIEGIGIGFVPPLWQPDMVNEIVSVSTAQAQEMARRLAREEGISAGVSSSANVVAALRIGAKLGPGATVATIIADSGQRYLSTEVYRDAPTAQALSSAT